MRVSAVSSTNLYRGLFPWLKLQVKFLPLRVQNIVRKFFRLLQLIFYRLFGNIPGEIGKLQDQIQVLEKGYLSGSTVKKIFKDIEKNHGEGANYIYTLYGKSEELKKPFLTRYRNSIFYFFSSYEEKGRIGIEISGYEHLAPFIAQYFEKRKKELAGAPQNYFAINYWLDIEKSIIYGTHGWLLIFVLRRYNVWDFNQLLLHSSFSGILVFFSGIVTSAIFFSFLKNLEKSK